MNSYRVRFNLGGEIYEVVVGAASSGSAMRLIERSYAGARNATVVSAD